MTGSVSLQGAFSRASLALGAAGVAAVSLASLAAACGGSTPPPKSLDDVAAVPADGGASDAAAEGGASVCTGPSLDLVNVLVQSACEVPNLAPDVQKPDLSALLDVKASIIPAQVAPGAHADVFITYTNKSKAPLALNFLLDPTPRFSIEVYTAKNARAEMPRSKAPSRPDPGEPTAPGTARITLTPGGKATARLDFNAVRLKWAPELVKGTPPELGYPTSPAGPLPKGTYNLKVVTPLIGVFEGSDREVSTAMTKVVVQ